MTAKSRSDIKPASDLPAGLTERHTTDPDTIGQERLTPQPTPTSDVQPPVGDRKHEDATKIKLNKDHQLIAEAIYLAPSVAVYDKVAVARSVANALGLDPDKFSDFERIASEPGYKDPIREDV